MQLNIAAQRTVGAAGEALLTKIEESADDTSSSGTLPRLLIVIVLAKMDKCQKEYPPVTPRTISVDSSMMSRRWGA
jgi:hypothetical protein